MNPMLARTTARLLQACAHAAGSTGLLCAAGAMLVLMLLRTPPAVAAPCAAVLLLLPLERLLCLRVRFDAGLFTDLAGAPARGDEAPSAGAALDAALHALQLRAPAAGPRPLLDRALGARRLALRHALVALAQFALLMSALALRLWA